MPVDPQHMRRVAEQNETVVDGVRSLSKRLSKLDGRNFEETSSAAKDWAANVRKLQGNLQEQMALGKAMRETARIQDEQAGDSFRDKYRFLVDRLKADIRYFFYILPEFVDLPQDFSHPRSWDHYAFDMELEIKTVSSTGCDPNGLTSLEPLMALLNYRDSIMELLLNGMLFQKAVLDWDLKSQRNYAEGPMVEMFERVVNVFSKSEMVPAKYVAENLPTLNTAGSFTYDKTKHADRSAGITELSSLQRTLPTTLREMQKLDKGMRNIKFGQQVTLPDMKGSAGKNIPADEMRTEVTKWYRKCQQLEMEVQKSKAERHAPWEVQVAQLTASVAEKDQQNKKQITRVHKLEADVQNLKYELQTLRRERSELADKNQRMMKENLPALDRMEKLLAKSQEAVDRLTADATMLSSMFRTQVQENQHHMEEREDISKKLKEAKRLLARERTQAQLRQEELQKKETLYLRAMAARRSIHESYIEQKQQITEVEDRMREQSDKMQEMLRVVEGRDLEIKQLNNDLLHASQRIDELESQKKMCMAELRKTGKSFNALLEGFKGNAAEQTGS
mmetsp:Transcript_8584/g.18734  ORF Transcript_8584/g.18734 Transcript_8584/m.18734 type:complete len:563 (+) Transcript_8584:256-1944(+)